MYVDEIRAYTPQNEQEAADQRLILEYIRLFPDNILTRDNEIAHLSSSGFVVNADGTRVLMAHHNIYRVWAWTGGHADGEGDLLSVALREAREETGVEHIRPLSPAIASLDILPVWGHVKRGKWVPSHQHLNVSYLLVADERDALQIREGENSRVGWLPAERLLEYTNEWQMDGVYAKLLAPRGLLELVPERPGLLCLPAPAGRRELLAAVEELLRLGEEAGALLPPRRSREEREVVERAKERLMARNGMTEEEAHRALRRRSMDCRIPLADAARMLLDEERPV